MISKMNIQPVNLRGLKIFKLCKHSFNVWVRFFFVEFEQYPLRFHTHLTYTLKDVCFQMWKFDQIEELVTNCVWNSLIAFWTVWKEFMWNHIEMVYLPNRACHPGPCLNIKISCYQYRHYHYKDKTVSQPYYLYKLESTTWKYNIYIETVPWWPLLRLLSRYLLIKSRNWNSFEDWLPVDFLYGYLICSLNYSNLTMMGQYQDSNSKNGQQVTWLIWPGHLQTQGTTTTVSI